MIVNPISGYRGTESLVSDIVRRLRDRGCDVDVYTTAASGDAMRLARNVPDTTHAVLAVGGDGTLREVAQGLVGRPPPLVVVPTGTENVIAQEIGMRRRAAQIVDTVLQGRCQACDVGFADGRCFLILAGVGFDGAVASRLASSRRGHISHLSYLPPLWHTLRTYLYPRVRVELDDKTVFDDRGLVFVGVMSRYSIGLRILRDAIWDDGLLDVCVLRCARRRSLMMQTFRVLARRHVESGASIYLRGKRLRVSSAEDVPVQIDGEAAGSLPIDCTIKRRALSLLTPRSHVVRGFSDAADQA